MSLFQTLLSYSHDTTHDGKQVVWVIGDSHVTRRNPTGTSYGPTPTANTVFQWDVANQNIYTIGATDILQSGAGANYGSVWPQAGIEYYNATDRSPVFVTCGSGGANYVAQGDNNDWSPTGSLYGPAKTELDACLAYLELTSPKYIIVGNGINDARSSDLLDDVEDAINAFYLRLQTDYPLATILIIQIGRSEVGEVSNLRNHAVRWYLRNVAQNNANVHIAAYEAPLFITGFYDSDLLHLLQTGNNEVGKMLGRWWANHNYEKWSRSIIACHFDNLSTTRKDLIQTWRTALGDAYFNLEFFYNLHTTIENNTYVDWAFLWAGNESSAGFTANDCITTNGTTSYWNPGFNNASMLTGTALSDGFIGLKIKTNRSAAGGTSRVAFGSSDGVAQVVIGQSSASVVYYRYNDLTLTTYPTRTKLPDDTFVSIGRSGGNKVLYENGTQVSTASVAAIATVNWANYIGTLHNNGTPSNFIDMDVEYAMGGKLTGFAQSDYYNAAEALKDAW